MLPRSTLSSTWAGAQQQLSGASWSAAFQTTLRQTFPEFECEEAIGSIAAGSDVGGNAKIVAAALNSQSGSLSGLHGFAATCPYFDPSVASPVMLRLADAALRTPLPDTLASAVQCGRTSGLISKAMMASRTPCIRMLLHPQTSCVMSNVSLKGYCPAALSFGQRCVRAELSLKL
jgi:hypothetical protein